jgi:hypothetical protein
VKSYIQTLLSHSKSSLNHLEPLSLWHMDDAGKFDTFTLSDGNSGFIARNKLIKGSKECFFNIPIHLDLFHISRLWPPGMNIQLRVYRSPPEFALVSGETNPDYTIEYKNLELQYTKCTLNPQLHRENEIALLTKNIQICYDKVVMYEYSLKQSQTLVQIPEIISAKLPKYLICGFVKTSALSGSYSHNPFQFEHLNIKQYYIRINGIQLPTFAFKTDFSPDGDCLEGFAALYDDLKIGRGPRQHFVTYDLFKSGCFFMVYDVTVDKCLGISHRHADSQGSISMHLQFEKGLTDAYTMLVFACYDESFEIDNQRRIIHSS